VTNQGQKRVEIMTDTKEYQTLSELVEALRQLQTDKGSGVFFLVTDKNRSASLAFMEGSLVDARFGPKKGNAALELIKDIERCTVKFSDTPPPTTGLDDTVPLDISILLLGEGNKSNEQLAVIENVLSGYLGPVAKMIVEEAGQAENDIDLILSKVAMELDDAEEQGEFIRKVREQLTK
jgi:hypothetical protein